MIFKLDMIPPSATGQMHKVGVKNNKPFFYDPPAVKDAKQKLNAYLYHHRPSEPLEGALALIVIWLYPIKGKHADMEYKTSKPDTDNLQKILKDCMTFCGFWEDDSQVVREIIEKRWAKEPGIVIGVFDANSNEEKELLNG